MPTEILDVTKRFMRDPIQILVKKEELTLEGIRQFYVNVEKEEWKVSLPLLKSAERNRLVTYLLAWNIMWFIWDSNYYTMCYILEYS